MMGSLLSKRLSKVALADYIERAKARPQITRKSVDTASLGQCLIQTPVTSELLSDVCRIRMTSVLTPNVDASTLREARAMLGCSSRRTPTTTSFEPRFPPPWAQAPLSTLER
jgi:hypothetical protein